MIKVDSLTKQFGSNLVLCNISFQLKYNEILLVTGNNGSGKTTLLKICAGLLKPTSGLVDVPNNIPSNFLSHKDGLYKDLTPFENLFLFSPKAIAREKVLEELSFWDIKDSLVYTPVKYLSAGERKKTALANIFLCPAPLILLDEPAANLDNQSKEKLINKITSLFKSKCRCAMIISTHDQLSFNSLNTKILKL